jgi:hypothetical protein
LVLETKDWKKPLSVAGIKTKSQQIIKHIIHNYAAFDISTIDKFTHKIIRAFAHDLGLPMTFEVTLDTENLLTEAVDALIAKAGEDEIITQLLIDFTMEKTDDDKSWDISNEILETGKLILNENNREEIVDFKDKNIEDFLAIKAKIAKAYETLENENIELAKTAFSFIESNHIDPKSFAYETFPKHIQFIINKDARAANHKFETEDEVKIKKGAKESALIEQILPQMLSQLAAVYANNEKKTISFTVRRYSEISDADIKVSEAEIKAFYEAHKGDKKYSVRNASRDVKMFDVNIRPSKADSTVFTNKMNTLRAGFSASTNDLASSSGPFMRMPAASG